MTRAAVRRKRAIRRRRLVWPLLASITVVALLFIGVYPGLTAAMLAYIVQTITEFTQSK